jgi:hypothetical protein
MLKKVLSVLCVVSLLSLATSVVSLDASSEDIPDEDIFESVFEKPFESFLDAHAREEDSIPEHLTISAEVEPVEPVLEVKPKMLLEASLEEVVAAVFSKLEEVNAVKAKKDRRTKLVIGALALGAVTTALAVVNFCPAYCPRVLEHYCPDWLILKDAKIFYLQQDIDEAKSDEALCYNKISINPITSKRERTLTHWSYRWYVEQRVAEKCALKAKLNKLTGESNYF